MVTRHSHFHRLSERQDGIEGIIEHRRLMKAQRTFAAENRERIDAEWDALVEPPRTIAGHLANIDPECRARLNAEWDSPIDAALESYRKVRDHDAL